MHQNHFLKNANYLFTWWCNTKPWLWPRFHTVGVTTAAAGACSGQLAASVKENQSLAVTRSNLSSIGASWNSLSQYLFGQQARLTPLPLPQHPNRCGLSENQKKGLDDKRIINISLKRCSFRCTRGDALPRHRLQIARWRAIICRGAQAAALHAADAPLKYFEMLLERTEYHWITLDTRMHSLDFLFSHLTSKYQKTQRLAPISPPQAATALWAAERAAKCSFPRRGAQHANLAGSGSKSLLQAQETKIAHLWIMSWIAPWAEGSLNNLPRFKRLDKAIYILDHSTSQ